jgi:hypothetical protein
MKSAVKGLIRGEKGKAMVMALILLVIGGLTATPLLAYMGSGLLAGEVYEKSTAELYAADAGVEDAVWNIQHEVPEVMGLTSCYPDWAYNMSDVNGRSVDITITLVSNVTFTYRVVSTATGDGSETEIDAYVTGESKYGDYWGIMDNVLTSLGEITLQPGANVTPSEGDHSPLEYYGGGWPEIWELEDFYGQQVEDEDPYPFGTIDLDGVDMDLEPLYRDGELEIVNSSNTPATLTLNGTVYVTGDTLIGKTGKDFTLDLNDHTIFVASDSSDPQKALWIGGQCNIVGPGVIVAIGDIYFEPNIEAGMTEPIFIMSITGDTFLQPGGDFYGSVAGDVEVQLQPGTSVNYPEEESWYDGYNFLIGVQQLIYIIYSWEVIQ